MNKKRIITVALVCAMVVVCVLLSLISCKTELDGVYVNIDNGTVSYTFDGDRFVKKEGEKTVEGTYSVYYGNIVLRYTENGEKTFDYLSYAQTRDLNEIEIDKSRFVKVTE